MKLSIVTTNKKTIAIRMIFFLLTITPIVLSIVFNFENSLHVNILNSTSAISFLMWLYSIYFTKTFSIAGCIEFNSDYLTINIPANSTNETIAYSNSTHIDLYYNEKKGDNYSGSYVGFGALRTKEGVNNSISINKRRYQVLIESTAKLILVQNALDLLLKKGVSVKIYE